jgi:N-acetylglucosaminyl-diphospho-decaprenol L-rhamnosyltransferase
MSLDPTTGIVIVTHNSASFIEPCLEAALARSRRVVVVDNASADSTCTLVRGFGMVRLIANRDNRGFATAVNQGFQALSTQLVLLLNPDAVLETDLTALERACLSPGIGAAAGPLVDPNGKQQRGFMVRRFPTPATLCFESIGLNRLWRDNPVNRRYRCLDTDLSTECRVEQPAGAFLMIRRDAWLAVGGFDEQFCPLWFEDVDFLRRLNQAGLGTMWIPEARASHYGGHSIAGLPSSTRRQYWYDSLLRYAAKHFGPVSLRLVSASVLLGCAIRSVTGKPGRQGKVVTLATRCFLRGDHVFRSVAGAELINSHDHVS